MKRTLFPTSLKCALAFAFCSLCIFLYSLQGPLVGGSTLQAKDDHCCFSCGSVEDCLSGMDNVWEAWETCYIVLSTKQKCKVGGQYCDCDL